MAPEDLRPWLDACDWQHHFDAATLRRAEQVALANKVSKLRLRAGGNPDARILEGRVRGSHGEDYDCAITLEREAGLLWVHSMCSCPVFEACKHAAAMLYRVHGLRGRTSGTPPTNDDAFRSMSRGSLAALLDIQRKREARLRWECGVALLAAPGPDPARPDPARTIAPGHCFGLLLRESGQGRRLLVAPVWMRPSRRQGGGWVAPVVVGDNGNGPVPAPAAGWDAASAEALDALCAANVQNEVGLRFFIVNRRHEERALETLMVAHGAWFERGDHPIGSGPALPAATHWLQDEDGSQRLVMQLEAAPDARIVRGHGLWYIDPAQARLGRVDGDPALFDQLQCLPALAPDLAPTVRRRLQASGSARRVPLPEPTGPIKDLLVAPVPGLSLRAEPPGPTATKLPQVGVARLWFDYAGHRFDAGDTRPQPTRRAAGKVVRILRDLEGEADWEKKLNRLGVLRVIDAPIPAHHRRPDLPGLDPYRDRLAVPATSARPLAPAAWSELLNALDASGFRLEFEPGFPHQTVVDIDAWHAELVPDDHAWFDVTLGVDIGGQRIDLLPVLRQLIADPAFPRHPGAGENPAERWPVRIDAERSIALPLAQLRQLIEPLLEWLESGAAGTARVHANDAAPLLDSGIAWHGGGALRERIAQLRQRPPAARPPRQLKATLRPYQLDGLAWLDFLAAAGLGGILADDMGLGKTVQVLAHILGQRTSHGRRRPPPVLVVCPTSLVGNWQAEAARFTPTLKVLALQGADRTRHFTAIDNHDIVITTYPLLPRDREALADHAYSLLVLDEAQTIKNTASQAARAVRTLHAERRLAMTGTPLENHLGELWAEFDAVEPGLLGSQRHFTRCYRTPIEKHGDGERQLRLNRRIGALMLRRRKDDVLTDLPSKIEILRTLELEAGQRSLYETLRLAQHERVRQAVARRGLAGSGIIVIDALLKLRQACCDPRLVKLASAQKVKTSAKLAALIELVENLRHDDRRILVFSQFTEMLALIGATLEKHHLPFESLTGQTPARERSERVRRFQRGDFPIFLISLKAGGTGLNLTAADTVIHYDPWWNPAVEAQATDRAHRIGQTKPVFVYRLICKGTVEEKIQAMQARKAGLAQAVLDGGGSTQRLRFDEGDLEALFGNG